MLTINDNTYQIGKELFMKELPLKLRLIGLRATNLKDLRMSDDKGIMKVRHQVMLSPVQFH